MLIPAHTEAVRQSVRRYVPAATLLVALVGAWQAIVSAHVVDPLILASPGQVARAGVHDFGTLMGAARVTLVEVLIGLGVAIVAGACAALAMHASRVLRDAAYPLLIASQAVPIVVIAPLLVLLFDYGIGPKVAIVALICFFPITVNLLDGLRSTDPELRKLMRSLGASRRTILTHVELPTSLPYLFSGLRIAATVSVIGAVFGEWAGAEGGLGRLVLLGTQQLETARAYAGVVLLTLMALAMFLLVTLVERAAVPWQRVSTEGR